MNSLVDFVNSDTRSLGVASDFVYVKSKTDQASNDSVDIALWCYQGSKHYCDFVKLKDAARGGSRSLLKASPLKKPSTGHTRFRTQSEVGKFRIQLLKGASAYCDAPIRQGGHKTINLKYSQLVPNKGGHAVADSPRFTWLSSHSISLVAKEIKACDDTIEVETARQEAAQKIEHALIDFFNVLALGLERHSDASEFSLAQAYRFDDMTARSVSLRIPVAFYDEAAFAIALCEDLIGALVNKSSDAAKVLGSKRWILAQATGGDLIVRLLEEYRPQASPVDEPISSFIQGRPGRFASQS